MLSDDLESVTIRRAKLTISPARIVEKLRLPSGTAIVGARFTVTGLVEFVIEHESLRSIHIYPGSMMQELLEAHVQYETRIEDKPANGIKIETVTSHYYHAGTVRRDLQRLDAR